MLRASPHLARYLRSRVLCRASALLSFLPVYRLLCLNTRLHFNKTSPLPSLLVVSLSRLQTEGRGSCQASLPEPRRALSPRGVTPAGLFPPRLAAGAPRPLPPPAGPGTSPGSSFPPHKPPGPGLTSAELGIKVSGR